MVLNYFEKCNKVNPEKKKEFSKYYKTKLPENSLTPIPLNLKKNILKNNYENKAFSNAQKIAVFIRRFEYSSNLNSPNNNKGITSDMMNKIILIQHWWKTIFYIIKIQKNIRGFLLRKKFIKKLENDYIFINLLINIDIVYKRLWFNRIFRKIKNYLKWLKLFKLIQNIKIKKLQNCLSKWKGKEEKYNKNKKQININNKNKENELEKISKYSINNKLNRYILLWSQIIKKQALIYQLVNIFQCIRDLHNISIKTISKDGTVFSIEKQRDSINISNFLFQNSPGIKRLNYEIDKSQLSADFSVSNISYDLNNNNNISFTPNMTPFKNSEKITIQDSPYLKKINQNNSEITDNYIKLWNNNNKNENKEKQNLQNDINKDKLQNYFNKWKLFIYKYKKELNIILSKIKENKRINKINKYFELWKQISNKNKKIYNRLTLSFKKIKNKKIIIQPHIINRKVNQINNGMNNNLEIKNELLCNAFKKWKNKNNNQKLFLNLYKKSIIKTLIHVKINNKESNINYPLNNININDKTKFKNLSHIIYIYEILKKRLFFQIWLNYSKILINTKKKKNEKEVKNFGDRDNEKRNEEENKDHKIIDSKYKYYKEKEIKKTYKNKEENIKEEKFDIKNIKKNKEEKRINDYDENKNEKNNQIKLHKEEEYKKKINLDENKIIGKDNKKKEKEKENEDEIDIDIYKNKKDKEKHKNNEDNKMNVDKKKEKMEKDNKINIHKDIEKIKEENQHKEKHKEKSKIEEKIEEENIEEIDTFNGKENDKIKEDYNKRRIYNEKEINQFTKYIDNNIQKNKKINQFNNGSSDKNNTFNEEKYYNNDKMIENNKIHQNITPQKKSKEMRKKTDLLMKNLDNLSFNDKDVLTIIKTSSGFFKRKLNVSKIKENLINNENMKEQFYKTEEDSFSKNKMRKCSSENNILIDNYNYSNPNIKIIKESINQSFKPYKNINYEKINKNEEENIYYKIEKGNQFQKNLNDINKQNKYNLLNNDNKINVNKINNNYSSNSNSNDKNSNFKNIDYYDNSDINDKNNQIFNKNNNINNDDIKISKYEDNSNKDVNDNNNFLHIDNDLNSKTYKKNENINLKDENIQNKNDQYQINSNQKKNNNDNNPKNEYQNDKKIPNSNEKKIIPQNPNDKLNNNKNIKQENHINDRNYINKKYHENKKENKMNNENIEEDNYKNNLNNNSIKDNNKTKINNDYIKEEKSKQINEVNDDNKYNKLTKSILSIYRKVYLKNIMEILEIINRQYSPQISSERSKPSTTLSYSKIDSTSKLNLIGDNQGMNKIDDEKNIKNSNIPILKQISLNYIEKIKNSNNKNNQVKFNINLQPSLNQFDNTLSNPITENSERTLSINLNKNNNIKKGVFSYQTISQKNNLSNINDSINKYSNYTINYINEKNTLNINEGMENINNYSPQPIKEIIIDNLYLNKQNKLRENEINDIKNQNRNDNMNNNLVNQNIQNRKGNYFIVRTYSPGNSQQSYMKNNLNNIQQTYQYKPNELNTNNNDNQRDYQNQRNYLNQNILQDYQNQQKEFDNNNYMNSQYYQYQQNEFDNNNNYNIQQRYQYQRNDLNYNNNQQRYQKNDFNNNNYNINDSINNNIYSSNNIQYKQTSLSTNNFEKIISNSDSPIYNSNISNNQHFNNPINLKKNYSTGNINTINDKYIKKINIEQPKTNNEIYIQEKEMNINNINQGRNFNNENILIYENKINPNQKKIKFSNEYYYYKKNVPLKIEEHLQTVRSESSSCNNSISGVELIETTNEKLQSIKYTSQSFVIKKDSNNILEKRNMSLSKNPMRMKGNFEDLIETIPDNIFNKNQRIQITNAQYPINSIFTDEINVENIELENPKEVRNYIMKKIVEKGDKDIYSNRYKIPYKKDKHKKTFSISFPIKPNNSTKFGIYNILGERHKNDSDKFELIHEGKYLMSSHSAQDINVKKSISPEFKNKNTIEYKPMKISYKLKELNSSQFYRFSPRNDEKLLQEKSESLDLIKRPFIYSILKKSVNKDRKNYFYTKKTFSTRTFSQSPQNNNLILNLNK